MHLIVKKEATKPAAKKLHKQQERFDASCTSTTRSACISDCHEVSSRALRNAMPQLMLTGNAWHVACRNKVTLERLKLDFRARSIALAHDIPTGLRK
jgi:hypothetical protein